MFWEYWKLNCSPFDNVPDPRMYCDRNPSLEDAISEVLFAVEEGNDCLAVMVGNIGLGKTLALRVISDELSPERYRLVFVTNPNLTFNQLLREIVGQLSGQPPQTRFKDALQEEFNRLLFAAAAEGKRVVILIDEANALSRSCLQNLRLLTNMQDDDRNLVTIILAGQLELGKRLEAPGMENLFQRIGVYCRIRGLETAAVVKDYVDWRLRQAGAVGPIFSQEAVGRLHRHSNGVPRLVNKLCKLALKAGETNNLTRIEADVVDQIAAMFEKGRVWRTEPQEATVAPVREAAQAAAPPRAEMVEGPEAQEPPVVVEAEGGEAVSVEAVPEVVAAEVVSVEAASEAVVVEPAISEPEPVAVVEVAAEAPLSPPEEPPVARQAAPQVSVPRMPAEVAGRRNQVTAEPLTPDQLSGLAQGLPGETREALRMMGDQELVKLAGQLAAKQMWQQEKAIRLSHGDPMDFWERSRAQIASLLRSISEAARGSLAAG
jgi:general secretion pathway protein A